MYGVGHGDLDFRENDFQSWPIPGVTNTIHIAYDNKYYVNINHALGLFPPYGDSLNGSRMRF